MRDRSWRDRNINGKAYEMPISDYYRLKERIESAVEISKLESTVERKQAELKAETERLFKLQHPENLGFHFPC